MLELVNARLASYEHTPRMTEKKQKTKQTHQIGLRVKQTCVLSWNTVQTLADLFPPVVASRARRFTELSAR